MGKHSKRKSAGSATTGKRGSGKAAADRGVAPSPPHTVTSTDSAKKTTGSKNGGMTEQQKLFCGAFATTGDALEAAKAAGYKDVSKAAKRLMGYQHVLDFIAELESILPPRKESDATLAGAVESGDVLAMLKALRSELAESIVKAPGATGKSQLSKEFRETIEQIKSIEDDAEPGEGSVLNDFYKLLEESRAAQA